MFWLKVNLILCLGLTFACFSSTSAGNASSIKKSTKAVKLFFEKVEKLDFRFETPSGMKNFGTIKYRTGFRSIRCSKEFLIEFRTEYEKLATFTKIVVTEFIDQIDKILKCGAGLLGKVKGRNKLCNYYTNKLIPDTVLEGDGTADVQIKESQTKLRNNLREIYNKICCKSSCTPGQTSPSYQYTPETAPSYEYKPQVVGSTHSSGTGGSFWCALCVGMTLD